MGVPRMEGSKETTEERQKWSILMARRFADHHDYSTFERARWGKQRTARSK